MDKWAATPDHHITAGHIIVKRLGEGRLLPPATKLEQGNVFTPVFHFVHGGSTIHPPRQTPSSGQIPPAQCMLGYSQQAGSTHPTGMQSCCLCECHRFPLTDPELQGLGEGKQLSFRNEHQTYIF